MQSCLGPIGFQHCRCRQRRHRRLQSLRFYQCGAITRGRVTQAASVTRNFPLFSVQSIVLLWQQNYAAVGQPFAVTALMLVRRRDDSGSSRATVIDQNKRHRVCAILIGHVLIAFFAEQKVLSTISWAEASLSRSTVQFASRDQISVKMENVVRSASRLRDADSD